MGERAHGRSVKPYFVDGEFVVLAGSTGSLNEKRSFSERQKIAREVALQTGRITKSGAHNFCFEEDVSFSSPSAAADFIYGSSRNGRRAWVVEGRSVNYGEWKDELIDRRGLG